MGYNSKILADAIKKLNERKVASKPKDIPLDVKGNGMLDPRFAGKPVKLNTDTLYNPTPYKIKAVADNGTERILNPFDESDVYFPGANTITEYPIGEYIDAELTDEEIKVLRDGGYVVEELPEMQPGGRFKPGTGYKMPALNKSEMAAVKKEVSKAKPVATKLTGTVGKSTSSSKAPVKKTFGVTPSGKKVITTVSTKTDEIANKAKEDAAYEKFLDQNLGKEGSNTYTYVDPRTGKTEQREYSNAHLKDKGNITVDEATWNANRDRQNMQHLSEALSGVGEITGINSAIRTGERLIDDPLKFADDLTTGISQAPETLVEGAMTLGSKLFGDNKNYVDVDTDALGVALDVAGALPVVGTAGKVAKPVLKTGLKYSDDVLNSLKGYRASAANKNLKNPNIQFQGSQIFDYEDVPEVLSALRQRGQNLDKLGAKGSDLLHSDMINYHGTYAGRPIVEVKMPDGSSEMFYKSSGWAGKKGAGTDGTTEGMWQVYGGHSKNPNAKADNWFIKDYGYTDYYGSNTYKEMAENLDNALIQKYNFKDVNELDDAFNFKNKYGNVDTYVPSSNDFPSTAFYKTNNARVNASDNLINESQIISDPNSKTSIIESLDQFPENIRPSKEQVQQVIDDNINYIKSPEYKKLRMQNTGETEAEVDKAINSYIKSFNKTKLTSKSNAGNSGQYTRGNFLFSPEIGIDPMITSSDEFLNILDHEIKHGLSPFSQSGKANVYKNYPVLEGTPTAKDPSLKEFFIGMDPNKKAMMADVNYHNLPYEQQVRALRLKNQIKKDLGISAETTLKESDIQNWMSKHPYRLPESLNDVEDLFRVNTSTPTNKGVANWLNNAWMTIPATGITGATIYGTSENSTEPQNYKEGGNINKMSKGGEAIKVINYLMSQGLTRQQASGIAGNLQQESSFRPNAKGSLGHVGIAQWDKNDRWPKVKKYIESQGLDPFSLDGQLAGLVWEAKKRKDWDKILKTKTPEESAQTWLKHFEISGEKPGQKGYENRLKYAKSLATQRDPNSPFDESVRDLFRLEAYREGLKNKSSVTTSNEIPYRGIRYNYPTAESSSNIDPLLTGAMKFNDDVTLDDIKPKKESSDLFASLLNMISAQEKEKEQEKLTEDPRQEVLKLLANQYPIPYSVIGNNSHQSFVNPYVYANDLSSFEKGGQKCPEGQVWDPETKSCRTTVKGYFDMLADAYKGSSLEKGIKTATKKVKDLGSEIAKTPVGQEAIKNYNDIIERDIIKIEDNRKIRATTGQPINPNRDLMSGEYNWHVVTNIINRAKKEGVDPYTALAIGLQESQLGKTDKENIGHSLYTNFKEDPYSYISFYKQKLNEADKANVSDEAARIQYYNGLGIVTPKTESNYHGYDMQSIYGVPIPSGGINLKNNPLYGKQIIDLRDNILKQNDRINQYIQNYKQDGGVANNYIETYIPKFQGSESGSTVSWMNTYNKQIPTSQKKKVEQHQKTINHASKAATKEKKKIDDDKKWEAYHTGTGPRGLSSEDMKKYYGSAGMGPQSAGNADWFWQAATLGPGILKGVYEGAPTILSALNTPIKNIPQLTANNLLMTYFGGHSAANLVDPESTSRQSLSKAYENPTAENILDAAGNTLTDALGVVFSPGVGGAMTAGANYLKDLVKPVGNAFKINTFKKPITFTSENQALIQQQRLLNPKIKAKFFKHQNPISAVEESAPALEGSFNLGKRSYSDLGNRITPENYENFVNTIHGSTRYQPASLSSKTPGNLGVGSYGTPGTVFSDAMKDGEPLTNAAKDAINAHEKNHGMFAGTLSPKMIDDLLKPFGGRGMKAIKGYSYRNQADEILGRMSQIKNALGFIGDEKFTKAHLNFVRDNYAKFFIDNSITEMLSKIKPGSIAEKKFIENMNKFGFSIIGATVIGNQLLPEKKQGGSIELYLTPEEIQQYLDGGYNVVQF